MFSNVAMFVNLLAENLGSDRQINCDGAHPGGRVIILDRYSADIHESLLKDQRRHSCSDYDLLILDDPMRPYEIADSLADSIYDGRFPENRKTEPRDDESRLCYYQSCRGVEGWTVVCLGLDSYYEEVCDIQPCHSDEFPSKVTRPAYSVLDKTKFKQTFGLKVPYWTDSLKKCIKNIK